MTFLLTVFPCFQCFLLYLKTLRDRARQRKMAAVKPTEGAPGKLQPMVQMDANDELQLTDDQRAYIFFLIIRLDFPPRIKPHSLLGAAGISILTPASQFGDLVKRATEDGQVAYVTSHQSLSISLLAFGPCATRCSSSDRLLKTYRSSANC